MNQKAYQKAVKLSWIGTGLFLSGLILSYVHPLVGAPFHVVGSFLMFYGMFGLDYVVRAPVSQVNYIQTNDEHVHYHVYPRQVVTEGAEFRRSYADGRAETLRLIRQSK